MYKLIAFDNGTLLVQRLADNAFIPFDPANTDFQEYQRWLDAGNTPEPANTQE